MPLAVTGNVVSTSGTSNLKHLQILQQATDAAGKKLEVVTWEPPRSIRDNLRTMTFAPGTSTTRFATEQ
jgi:hypothetical protein